MVYDNLWWSGLFVTTCAGLPGLNSVLPSHHLIVETQKLGQEACRTGQTNNAHLRVIARHQTADPSLTRSLVLFEWCTFTFCIILYVAFNTYFVYTLQDAICVAIGELRLWVAPAVWYWLSAAPALGLMLPEVVQNRTVLFEPDSEQGSIQERHKTTTKGRIVPMLIPTTYTGISAAAPGLIGQHYRSVDDLNFLQTWCRIAQHQWRRSKYRVLVRPPITHWYRQVWRLCFQFGRIVVFSVGSIVMGNTLLMPIPNDLICLVILMFLTGISRLSFPGIWANGARGADLVVIVRPLGIPNS